MRKDNEESYAASQSASCKHNANSGRLHFGSGKKEKRLTVSSITLPPCAHTCPAFRRVGSMASLIIDEEYPTWLTSKLSRFIAHLGSLIMSSSFFSRVSILLSAPTDMTAAVGLFPNLNQIWIFRSCLSLHVKRLCSWLMVVGLAEQPWALSPPKPPPNRNSLHNAEKNISPPTPPKKRLPASQKLPSERGLS